MADTAHARRAADAPDVRAENRADLVRVLTALALLALLASFDGAGNAEPAPATTGNQL